MSPDYFTIEFPLKPDLEPISLDYLPFGTRTLKILVTNPDHVPGRLIIRSSHLPDDFGKSRFY